MNDLWPKSYRVLLVYAKSGLTNPIYVSEENNCKHIANNRDKNCVYHIKVDGDMIPKTCRDTKRIDFLLLNETKKTAYFIELKGSHVKDAFEQLEVTNRALGNLLQEYEIKWRVVHHSRTLRAYTSDVIKYLRNHPNLKIDKTPMEENI